MRWTDAEYAAYLVRRSSSAEDTSIRRQGTGQRPRPQPVQGYATRLEAARALLLEQHRLAGEVVAWWYQPFSLRLAPKTFYRPDFLVQWQDGTLAVEETKAHWEDDSRVKIKVAAALYPCFRFVAWQRKRGQWIAEYFTTGG